MNHELRELYQGNEEVAHLIDMSRRLEGLPRHTSDARRRCCHRLASAGGICAALARKRRNDRHAVHDDDARGTGTF